MFAFFSKQVHTVHHSFTDEDESVRLALEEHAGPMRILPWMLCLEVADVDGTLRVR